jgi:hypothetical protein
LFATKIILGLSGMGGAGGGEAAGHPPPTPLKFIKVFDISWILQEDVNCLDLRSLLVHPPPPPGTSGASSLSLFILPWLHKPIIP